MKFKNIKKKASSKGGSALGGKSVKSPSNFRTITETSIFSFPKITSLALYRIYRGSLKAFIVIIFLLAVFSVGIDLQKNLNNRENIDRQRDSLIKELKFWQDFITEHKDYRDAYFQTSILEYRLGDSSKAKMYVEKGLSLDPNSENGKKLEKFLEGK